MTESNPDQDPVDALLRAAFAADQAGCAAPAMMTARVMARIRSRQRWRRLVLGGGIAAGLAIATVLSVPTVAELAAALGSDLWRGWHHNAAALGALILLIGGGLVILDEDPV